MSDSPNINKKLGLVLSGGGARGAYEAGVIHYIRSGMLPPEAGKRHFDIICGASAGALNSCFIAATSHNLQYQGQNIFNLWSNLSQSDIYKRGFGSLAKLVFQGFNGIVRNYFRRKPFDPTEKNSREASPFRGLLDTSPFPLFLDKAVPWKQVALNIQKGVPLALSITATNIHTGKLELFIQKHPSINYTGRYQSHEITIETPHAMASAAIPILFPPVRVGKDYYCDGGLRLNTPLSPAIQLGADKVLVVGVRHVSERAETLDHRDEILDWQLPPTMGEVIGKVFNSMFLDRLDYDLEQLKRINQIVDWGEKTYGSDFIPSINRTIKDKTGTQKDIGARGLKKLEVMTIFPSRDLRSLFNECMKDTKIIKSYFTSMEKTLLRILDVDLRQGKDFLSFILFIPSYINKLLELGYQDAQNNRDQLIQFLTT